jgi:hypothetical protein
MLNFKFIRTLLTPDENIATLESAKKAQETVFLTVKDLKGFEGVGISKAPKGGYTVKVNISASASKESRSKVPKSIGNVPVVVQIIQEVSAF